MKLFFISYFLILINSDRVFSSLTRNLTKNLQIYIKFNTVSNNHKFDGVGKWLSDYIERIGLDLSVIKCNEEKPVLIGTFWGEDPNLKSILLNSHYDVVPANRDLWDTDPFGGELGEYKGEQVIYGRGSQDDKSLTIMHLEALRMLKKGNFKPKRTIHITIVPDEETDSKYGMECLIRDPIFKSLNIGAALDEGFLSTDNKFYLFYGERAPWYLNVTARGDTGHSSKFIGNLAINKLTKFMMLAEGFRKEQEKLSKFVELGKVTTMNLSRMGGGTANNVVPDTLWAMYNVRVTPSFGPDKIKRLLNTWANIAKVELEYINAIDPTISPHNSQAHFYNTIVEATKEFGYPITTQIFPGATDGRLLREAGIPSYSLTPCTNVETRAHDHNEYIPVRCLQAGLLFFTNLIPKLSNLSEL